MVSVPQRRISAQAFHLLFRSSSRLNDGNGLVVGSSAVVVGQVASEDYAFIRLETRRLEVGAYS